MYCTTFIMGELPVKILIFSDTHQNINGCIDVIQNTNDVDAVLHAGDLVRDAEDLAAAFPALPFYFVSGNNDIFEHCPDERLLMLAGVKILLTHGHQHGVRYGERELAAYAKKKGAALAVFGHTHKPFDGVVGGIRLLNPGTMGYAPKSYAQLTIEDEKIQTKIISYS